jgi:predicted dithiol-disulfide oxidoreductase (DUF899 family)
MPRRFLVVSVLIALAATALVVVPAAPASAKSAYDSAYGFDRTWNAGLRLVRVDLGLKVTEKDDTNGYLLFDYKSPESGQKPVPGSMEFIKGKDGDVRVVVQIAQMPGYHEQVLVDHLQRKLRSEYGDPPKKAPAPSAPKDAGPDAEPSSP